MNASDDCFAGTKQAFLICVTVHKASEVGVPNGELYVKVSLDKMSKSTKTFPNSVNPFFNEYFVFEFNCTLAELLRHTILFELKKYVLCKKNLVIGDLLIDLHSVWNQPNHGYFKKWGRLETPVSEQGVNMESNESHGYLQIDLAIVSQHSAVASALKPDEKQDTNDMNKWAVDPDFDDIKSNLLQNMDSCMQSNIRYFISFYRGYFVKKSNYMIQVSFAGFNGKTPVAKNTTTPVWNHEISFAWMYPSLAQRFLILILAHEHLQWKCMAEYELSFEEIAFKDKPSLGPTYLHLYDPVNPLSYVGRLLLQVRAETLKDEKPTHVLIAQNTHGMDESRYWHDDIYQVEFLPLLGNHIHSNASNYKIQVKLAEHSSNTIEGQLRIPPGKFSKLDTKYFRQDAPYHSCMLRARMPDNRAKFESDYFMADTATYMKSELDTFKIFQLKYSHQYIEQAKCIKSIITNILNKVKDGVDAHRFDYEVDTQLTTWDINRQLYLLDYFAKMPRELRLLRQKLKSSPLDHMDATIVDIVNDLHRLIGEISSLANMMRVQDDWPDLILVLTAGGKDVGTCKLNAKNFLDLKQRQKHPTSNKCWRVQSFTFKNVNCAHSCTNCGCTVGVVLGCMAIVVERERKDFLAYIAGDWMSQEPMTWQPNVTQTHFRCHVYVHQAKVRPGVDKKGQCDGYLRVIFGDKVSETYAVLATLSPIWNAVITFKSVVLPGSINWYIQNPPQLALELYDADKMSDDDLLGQAQSVVSVISNDRMEDTSWDDAGIASGVKNPLQKLQRLKNVTPPPLKWVPVSKMGVVQAEVLMSAEFIELVGDVDAHGDGKETAMATGIPLAIRPNMLNYVLEVIFVGLRNYKKSGMSSAGKRRIKVMMADLVLSSGLSTSRVRNSINFLVAYAAGVVSLPDQQEYWPAMIATDVTLSGSNGESTLGAALIPNSTSFLQKDETTKCMWIDDNMETSVASTMLTIDYDEDIETELMPPVRVDSCWTRIKNALGLRTSTYANQKVLKNADLEASELLAENQFTWWTKFYNSMYTDAKDKTYSYKHRLVIYANELEKQAQFGYLQDWAVPVQLVHGVKQKKNAPPKEDIYATLKLQIKLTPCKCDNVDDIGGGDMLRPLAAAINPRHQSKVQALSEVVKFTARIYVVQGLQMRPRDSNSHSDCYVKLFLGAKTISDSAHYVPNQSNPIFGRFFELEATLPGDHMLRVLVYDHDKLRDDIIGHTLIDLEDRWRSKHRATVGIAHEYSRGGYNMWHDVRLPSEILMDLCLQRGVQQPYFYGNVVEVDGMLFADETVISKSEDLQERLSLTVLKNLDKLPSFGYKLVPEHVETRSLYRDDYPGLEQGKLQMWVELFEANMYNPKPIDITPIPPTSYEVRVVVKNLSGIQAGDKNIFGKLMSDLFVRGWCQDTQKHQSTDIHYRAFAGKASFNWRMIFAMMYSPNEDMMVIRRKSGFNEEFEIKRPPIIYLQVWDKDVITQNDYLGAIELNLSNIIKPYSTAAQCDPQAKKRKRLNLFKRKHIKGWFPLHSPPKPPHDLPVTSMSGKIELQVDVCTETEASDAPAGYGREPPMALEAPHRAETAFNPLTHPLKSFCHILWPAIRKYVFLALLFVIVTLGLVLFVSNLPGKLLGIPLE
ncbi:fer-1-like protein 6 isoform X1 [Scaptodrosophila lebanonensis]|uniref:Fer-1-like protein 6 isoform X1 n=1 Tax=Drosophila lebanonensis TaxID=7225 RepID=A0A6J2UC24_DROLE|nr:fer-1-like protein 6 isoform X1 [Scaptodrosophila lebanonensis]